MNVETQRPVISCTHVGFNNSSATAATRRRGRDDDDSFNGVTTLVLHRGGGATSNISFILRGRQPRRPPAGGLKSRPEGVLSLSAAGLTAAAACAP